jgi:hypothetical protein
MRTLVDCACETKVHKDGSGVEVYLCPLHEAAPEMLRMLTAFLDFNPLVRGSKTHQANFENWKRSAQTLIAKAIGQAEKVSA